MAAGGGAGAGSAAAPAAPVSFGFSRRAERRRGLAAGPCAEPAGDDAGGAGDTDFLTAVEDRELLSARPAPPPPKELIIPLIPPHRWRNPEPPPGDADHAPSAADHAPSAADHAPSAADHAPRTDSIPDVEAQAVQELLQEARQSQERGEGDPGPPISIPMCLRDPDGATRQQPDYSEVPVGAFGLAMLRGMGWSQGEGIGRTFKKVVKPLELRVRPRGLGLGAEPPPPPPPPGSAPPPAAPPPPTQGPPAAGEGLQVGAPVRVQSGAHRDALGTVEGLDPETARAVVRLRGGAAVTVSQYSLRLEHPSKTPREDEPPDAGVPPNCGGNKRKDPPPKPDREAKRVSGSPPWLRRDLRVRCVDKEFRAGRFYNCKLVVEDVVTPERCVCRTDDGRLVEGLRAAMLETVVPRGDGDRVMVVLGEHAGRVGRILRREPGRSRALVQLDKDEAARVLPLDYDAICHYVGRGEDD